MFAVGIKNAILIALLIMIVHFAIKNILFDKRHPGTIVANESQPSIIKESFEMESPAPKCVPDKQDLGTEKDNLLKFVFGDEGPKDNKGLDEFFKDFSKQISNCEKPYEVCSKKSDDHNIPLQSSCDPKIQELPAIKEMDKKPPCNNKRDLMIVNEYDNENPMNGGTLYANINAFDGFDLNFQEYSCPAKKN